MKYSFSSQFLRTIHPDTNFGEAWESLCHDLLVAETCDHGIVRLGPPDKGVDILRRSAAVAYQCKSDERGAVGSLSADSSTASLETALEYRGSFSWKQYTFATNANYTGTAYAKIMDTAKRRGLCDGEIEFLGPEYWSHLCDRHFQAVKHRLDFRISVSEDEVVEAFRKARYFDKYVNEYKQAIQNARFKVIIKNNRTPLEIEVPFSPDLSVENCVDAVQELLGISLAWTNYPDLGTSAGPSISLTVGQKAQGFSQKIKDLEFDPEQGLQLWITIVWDDKRRDDGRDAGEVRDMTFCLMRWYESTSREALSYPQRKDATINRTEDLIQAMIWKAAEKLGRSA